MLIKALVTFAGAECMNMGEVRDISDEKFAAKLVDIGYAAIEPPPDLLQEEKNSSDDPAEKAEGDADENIGNNISRRKKGVKN